MDSIPRHARLLVVPPLLLAAACAPAPRVVPATDPVFFATAPIGEGSELAAVGVGEPTA